jgi:hypothetical protein
MGGIKPPEFRSSSNCLEGTQTGQGDDDRSTNQLAAAMLFQGPDVELIGDRFIQRLPICKRTPISPASSSVQREQAYSSGNARIGPIALADLGNDVRVEQELQRLISRHCRWRGCSNTPAKTSSGRSEPNTSNAVLISGWTRAFTSADRSTFAFSDSSRSVSANARIRSASLLGA